MYIRLVYGIYLKLVCKFKKINWKKNCQRNVSNNKNNNTCKKIFMGQKQFHFNLYFSKLWFTSINDLKWITYYINYILSSQVNTILFLNRFIQDIF